MAEVNCNPPNEFCGVPDDESSYKPPYLPRLKAFSLISSDGESELISSDGSSELATVTYV